jgi:hypothetical protein
METMEQVYARETVLLADFPAKVSAPLQIMKIGDLHVSAIPAASPHFSHPTELSRFARLRTGISGGQRSTGRWRRALWAVFAAPRHVVDALQRVIPFVSP